jgi:hypothetical protein
MIGHRLKLILQIVGKGFGFLRVTKPLPGVLLYSFNEMIMLRDLVKRAYRENCCYVREREREGNKELVKKCNTKVIICCLH